MATVRIQKNILEETVDTFSVEKGTTIESIIREHTDGNVYDGTLVECYDLETGKTYFAPIENDSTSVNAIVQVNGKDATLDYKVDENDVIAIVITPAGGDIKGGWDWLGALGGLIVGGLVGFVYGGVPGMLFGAFSGFVGGGLIVGSAIETLKAMNDIKSTSGIESEKLPDVRGATNQPLLEQAYPFVIGKHLVTPFIIGSPWNEISGNRGQTNYIHVLYAVGYAPLRLTDFKLGDMFLAHNQRWADNKDMRNIFHGALTGIDHGDNDKGMDYYQANTTIDLRNRPLVDAATMRAAGWSEVEDGEIATVYSSAFSNQQETKTVLVTPILSDGTVLTPSQLESDAEALLNDTSISHNILLNTFNGADSIEQSEKYAEGLHNSQATYYGLNGDIVNTWFNNDITLEILQQGQNGEEVDYGTVYPYAKIQSDINANVLYIADGSLEEIDSGNSITYKGLGLKNGLRNNPIRFTEEYAKSAKIELDFQNGLYKSRSETDGDESKVKYSKIPMWVALQWRVFSEENEETDGSVSGGLPLPNYDPITKTYDSAKRGWISFASINGGTIKPSLFTEQDRYNDIEAHTGNKLKNEHVTDYQKKYTSIYFLNKRYFSPLTFANSEVILQNKSYWVLLEGDEIRANINSYSQISGSEFYGKWGDFYEEGAKFTVSYTGTIHQEEKYNADINSGWLNSSVFNLQELGGTNSDKEGINEIRCIADIDFVQWARETLLTDEDRASENVEQILASKFNAYFYDGYNTTRSIEVRVVRISPCYLDETVSSKDKSAFKFNDVFTWSTLTSEILDGDKLTKQNQIVQKRPLSDECMRKLCIVSLKAKTDNVDQLTNTIKKFSCIAQSFAPYYDSENRQWVPERVTKTKKYFRPPVKVDKNGNRGEAAVVPPFTWEPGEEITEQQFYEDRQNGTKSVCYPSGNDYVKQMMNIIKTNSHKDSKDRYFIPYDNKEGNVYKPDCDGTLNFCTNLASSMFILAGIGPHLGVDALGYEQKFYDEETEKPKSDIGDFNLSAFGKWNEEVKCVKDGSYYTSDGYHYNIRGERIHHVAKEEVEMFFAANAYVYQSEQLESIFAKIAMAGRAVYTRDSKGRITVIMDKPEQYPVALINQQNTLKSSYTISFEELPSGLQISFPDENDGYQQNNFYCMRDGEDADNPHGAIEPYQFAYVTNNYQQNSLGNYLLANRILNREVVTKQLGIEGASIGLGNLVLVSDDTMLIGTDTGARISKLLEDNEKIYGFIINNSYKYTGETEIVDGVTKCKQGCMVMQPSQYKEYKVITLRLAQKNTSITVDDVTYIVKKGNTNVVIFDVPITKTQTAEGGDFYYYKPAIDNLVSFGIVGKITATYRVIKIKGNNNRTFDFTLAKYQKDLYNYGRALPSFQNNMTQPDRSDEDSFAVSYNINRQDLQESMNEMVNLVTKKVSDLAEYNAVLSMSAIGSAVMVVVYKNGELATDTLYYEDYYGIGTSQPTSQGATGTIIEGTTNISAVTNANKHMVKIFADQARTDLVATAFVSYGDTGSGSDSTSYWMIEDATSIKCNSSGVFTPSKINVSGMKQTGTSAPTSYTGRIKIEYSTNGTTYQQGYSGDTDSYEYTIPANTKSLRVSLYVNGGTTTLLDQDVIPVVNDGTDGGYQDYQFAVGDFGLTDEQARALDWYDAPPTVPDGKCLYMATKFIQGA